MNSAAFRIELFGAPRVLQRGAEVRLPIRKSLALLAYLAIEGRATRAKLAALFWGESGDEAARRNLRRELHRLREAGLGDIITADDACVTLAPCVTSDTAEFDAAEQSRSDTALALYRGPLLDGFEVDEAEGFERWLAARRDHFAQRWSHIAAAEASRFAAQGDPRAALALHLRLIEADALQETQFVAAMRLASQLGERSRALELYERCRATLQRELGLEPLPDTIALAEQIRAAESLAPFAEPAVNAGLAELAAPFVGRDATLAALRAAGTRIRLIVGEPGVGKSRLADEYTRGGAPRMLIAGSELMRNAPLQAVAAALARALADAGMRKRVQALDGVRRHELARLLPELDGTHAHANSERREDSSDSPAARKARLLEAVGAALRTLAADGAIVFEDLHWGDALTLDLIEDLAHRLARERADSPVIVLTARMQELGDHAAAQTLMLRLERAQLLQRFELAPLDGGATAELVQRLSGSGGGTVFAQRLQRATQGNPFFLLETIRFLFASGELAVDERGQWTTRYDEATSDYAELPVPPTIQQAVLERVARLGPAARRVLETAALAGDGFTLDEVQPATALSDWEALDGLERAAGASLIAGAERHYRFGHDLVRVALDGSLGTERRRLIHLRLAETLAARHAAPGRVAWHYDGAGQGAAAVPWHLAAARSAAALYAHADALLHYTAALQATSADAERVLLHRARVELMMTLHDLAGADAELSTLGELTKRMGDTLLAAEVLALRVLLAIRRHRYADAVAVAQQAEAHEEFHNLPLLLQRETLIASTFARVELGEYDVTRAFYEHELDRGDLPPRYRGQLHNGMANLLTSNGHNAEAAGHLRRAAALFEQIGEPELQNRSLNLLAYTQFVTDDCAAAIKTMDAALAVAERLNSTTLLRNTLLNFVAYTLAAGDFERSAEFVSRARQVLGHADDPATQARLAIREAEVSESRGHIGAALVAARRALQHIEDNGGGLPDYWPWRLLSRLLWNCGEHEAAIDVYARLRGSPAWQPRAEVAVNFFTTVYRLPHEAEQLVSSLGSLEPGPGLICSQQMLDFHRASALHTVGRDAEALALLMPDGAPLKVSPFEQHRAQVIALTLSIQAALGRVDAALVLDAEQLVPLTPPFEQLELRAALARTAEAAGHAAAKRHMQAGNELVEQLAASLVDSPIARAERLRRFWLPRLTGTGTPGRETRVNPPQRPATLPQRRPPHASRRDGDR